MAELTGGGATEQMPVKVEVTAIPYWSLARVTRRQWTLIAITGLLNVLFGCSLLCIIVQIYQMVSDSNDLSNVVSDILTFTTVRFEGRGTWL